MLHYLVSLKQSEKMWPIISFETEEGAKAYIEYRIENAATMDKLEFSIDLIDHRDE